jgi:hypothetical protein
MPRLTKRALGTIAGGAVLLVLVLLGYERFEETESGPGQAGLILPAPPNAPINLEEYHPIQARPGQNSTLAVAVAISGGGHRAANYAAGVLAALEQIQRPAGSSLLDEVDFLSTVSGGGIAAGVFVANRYDAAQRADTASVSLSESLWTPCDRQNGVGESPRCLRRVLRTNYERRMTLERAHYKVLLSRTTAGDGLQRRLDDEALGRRQRGRALTLRDIFVPKGSPQPARWPYWVANATIYENGAILPFTPDVLRRYQVSGFRDGITLSRQNVADDPSRIPLAVGLKASASFPVLIPGTVLQVSYRGDSAFMRRSRVTGPVTAYLRLIDGGIGDNLGIQTAFNLLCGGPAPTVRRRVLIVVDAYPGHGSPYSSEDRTYYAAEALPHVGVVGLDAWRTRHREDVAMRSRRCETERGTPVQTVYLSFDELRADPTGRREASGSPSECSSVRDAAGRDASEEMLDSLGTAARKVGTRLKIDAVQQDLLLRAGRAVVARHCGELVRALSQTKRDAAPVSGAYRKSGLRADGMSA